MQFYNQANEKVLMMTSKIKLFILIYFILNLNIAYGQFAIISDSFCNVRNSNNNIIDKLENSHIVFCFQDNSNWTDVSYFKKNEDLYGKVHNNNLIYISSYESIPILELTPNKIKLKKNNIEITLIEQRFDKNKHIFSFYKESENQIELIDNKQYWGCDGGYPTTEYKSIEVYLKEKKILLPIEAFKNLYQPSLFYTQVNYDEINDILYIQSSNSDGAGGYEVIWKIEKGTYKYRYVAYGF